MVLSKFRAQNFSIIREPCTVGTVSPSVRDPLPTTLETCNGFYLTAESGGGREVAVNRTEAGPGETCTVHTYDDGRVSLQAHDGRYLTAALDDSVIVQATESGEWERFTIEVRGVGGGFF